MYKILPIILSLSFTLLNCANQQIENYPNGNKKSERKYKEDMGTSEITRWKSNGELIK